MTKPNYLAQDLVPWRIVLSSVDSTQTAGPWTAGNVPIGQDMIDLFHAIPIWATNAFLALYGRLLLE